MLAAHFIRWQVVVDVAVASAEKAKGSRSILYGVVVFLLPYNFERCGSKEDGYLISRVSGFKSRRPSKVDVV
jgi:hypothetical protein